MNIGNISPNFNLRDQNGQEFILYNKLDKNVLLIFYPKDNTPVCSKQLRDYQLNIDKFLQLDIQPVAVNIADEESHKNFCEDINLKFPILSDTDKKVSKLFKAINFLGQNKRMVILIGKDKKIKMIRKMLSLTYTTTDDLINEIKLIDTKLKA